MAMVRWTIPVASVSDNVANKLLSWDGGANQHYRDLTDQIVTAINDRHREHVKHDKLPCVRRSNCPMRVSAGGRPRRSLGGRTSLRVTSSGSRVMAAPLCSTWRAASGSHQKWNSATALASPGTWNLCSQCLHCRRSPT